jgi:hypothetical protein
MCSSALAASSRWIFDSVDFCQLTYGEAQLVKLALKQQLLRARAAWLLASPTFSI